MQTRIDMENALTNRLNIGQNSNTFGPARITQEIQDAYIWASGLFWWTALTKARVTTAVQNAQGLKYDYYDYPSDFLDNTISRLYIDGLKYDPKAFNDVVDYADQSNNPSDPPDPTKRFFANFSRQYFVYPSYIPTGNTKNLIIWGQIQASPLAAPLSTTIFSFMNDSLNEAIVKKALAVLWKRIEPQLAAAEETEAINLLKVQWKKETEALQKLQRLNHVMFNVPNLYGNASTNSSIGNFNNVLISN